MHWLPTQIQVSILFLQCLSPPRSLTPVPQTSRVWMRTAWVRRRRIAGKHSPQKLEDLSEFGRAIPVTCFVALGCKPPGPSGGPEERGGILPPFLKYRMRDLCSLVLRKGAGKQPHVKADMLRVSARASRFDTPLCFLVLDVDT